MCWQVGDLPYWAASLLRRFNRIALPSTAMIGNTNPNNTYLSFVLGGLGASGANVPPSTTFSIRLPIRIASQS